MKHLWLSGTRRREGKGAFTITEVIISVGLLAVSLLAVIGLFTSALRFQKQSKRRGEAIEKAKAILERIRAAPNVVPAAPRSWTGGQMVFTPLAAGPPTFPPQPYPYDPVSGFAFDVTIDSVDAKRPGMKLVRVVVRGDDGKQVELQTLIHD